MNTAKIRFQLEKERRITNTRQSLLDALAVLLDQYTRLETQGDSENLKVLEKSIAELAKVL